MYENFNGFVKSANWHSINDSDFDHFLSQADFFLRKNGTFYFNSDDFEEFLRDKIKEKHPNLTQDDDGYFDLKMLEDSIRKICISMDAIAKYYALTEESSIY